MAADSVTAGSDGSPTITTPLRIPESIRQTPALCSCSIVIGAIAIYIPTKPRRGLSRDMYSTAPACAAQLPGIDLDVISCRNDPGLRAEAPEDFGLEAGVGILPFGRVIATPAVKRTRGRAENGC